MPTHAFFPTLIHTARLDHAGWRRFNNQLLRECLQLREDDEAGQRWSKKNYPGGYTSYNSVAQMNRLSPTFAALERRIDRQPRKRQLINHEKRYDGKYEWIQIQARPFPLSLRQQQKNR